MPVNSNQTFLDLLIQRIRQMQQYDPMDQTPPAAILWPDGKREWQPLLSRLRQRLPILTLGPYDRAARSGPAPWLRCMLARQLDDKLAPNVIPVIYLPGVQSTDLRLAEKRTKTLEALADLHYRSSWWTRPDGDDWAVADFFQQMDGGLGIQMRDDDFTKRAMLRVLPAVCNLTLGQLQEEAPWKAKDFERLLEADITALIALGESAELEFKSTARWDMKEQKANSVMEKIIIKTVAGFLNSDRSGTLLIGVEDYGTVCGIQMDYQTFSKAEDQNEDGYELWLMRSLLNAYGQEFAPYIHCTFHQVKLPDGAPRTVCKVTVTPASTPVIIEEAMPKSGAKEEVFYLRTGNATNRLSLHAAIKYCLSRWK